MSLSPKENDHPTDRGVARFREERPPSEKGAHHAAAKGGNTTTLKVQIGRLFPVSRAAGGAVSGLPARSVRSSQPCRRSGVGRYRLGHLLRHFAKRHLPPENVADQRQREEMGDDQRQDAVLVDLPQLVAVEVAEPLLVDHPEAAI